ncbi:MAG: glucosamine-6-phosphate deaminase [Clostridiales bacterium]|nr:glucosamine-6-phosphate deaminase [Clostridiales bacterium]
MNVIVCESIAAQCERVAQDLKDYILTHPGALLCLAAGDTPLPAYERLIAMQQNGEVDLNSVYYVGLDEWVGIGGETRGSCRQVMQDVFYGPAGIKADHMAVWDGLCTDPHEEIERIMDFINAHGGLGYTLLGIGMNGHVGFNEPGVGLPEGGILVDLDETTVSVSVKYFDTALPVRQGLTLGAGELKKAGMLCLMANAARKAPIVKKVLEDGPDAQVPASLLVDHENGYFYLDAEAASQLNG